MLALLGKTIGGRDDNNSSTKFTVLTITHFFLLLKVELGQMATKCTSLKRLCIIGFALAILFLNHTLSTVSWRCRKWTAEKPS